MLIERENIEGWEAEYCDAAASAARAEFNYHGAADWRARAAAYRAEEKRRRELTGPKGEKK